MDGAHTAMLVAGLLLEVGGAILIGSDFRRLTDEAPNDGDPSGSDVGSKCDYAERVKIGCESPGEISFVSWIGVLLAFAGIALLMVVAVAIT